MGRDDRRRLMRIVGGFVVSAGLAVALLALRPLRDGASSFAASANAKASPADSVSDPWTDAQTVAPADLVKELGNTDAASRPVVACVGFHSLYEGAHVPGASFHGPGSKDEGNADLKKWAGSLPRSANVVLYCGCCPMARCPNLRPAFSAVRDMGFKRLRVLVLPQDFATDWVAKGYPIEKGK
jgi:thiosulfate/3-mercaptopyruvate sulfurtransferase